jgi:hypothetical protein
MRESSCSRVVCGRGLGKIFARPHLEQKKKMKITAFMVLRGGAIDFEIATAGGHERTT